MARPPLIVLQYLQGFLNQERFGDMFSQSRPDLSFCINQQAQMLTDKRLEGKATAGVVDGIQNEMEGRREMKLEQQDKPETIFTQASSPLPPELLLKVLHMYASMLTKNEDSDNHLLYDLANCRLVSKFWKPIVEEVLLRPLIVKDPAQAFKLQNWLANNPHLMPLIRECHLPFSGHHILDLLPSCDKLLDILPSYDGLLRLMPALAKLTMSVQDFQRLTLPFQPSTRLQDISLFTKRNGATFSDIRKKLEKFHYLRHLSLRNVVFTYFDDNKIFPLSLASLELHQCKCGETDAHLQRIFERSQETLERLVLGAIGNFRTNRDIIKELVNEKTPLNHLATISSVHELFPIPPLPLPEIATVSCDPELLPVIIARKPELISKAHRLVITGYSLETISPSQVWASLLWLQLSKVWFGSRDQSAAMFSYLGTNIRVLCLHQTEYLPRDLANYFPQLRALSIDRAEANPPVHSSGPYCWSNVPAGWFVPTLRVFRFLEWPSEAVVEYMLQALAEGQSPELKLFICGRTCVDEWKKLIKRSSIDYATEEDCFEMWARRFVDEAKRGL